MSFFELANGMRALMCAYLVVGHGADRRDDQFSVPRYVRAVVPKVGVLETTDREVRCFRCRPIRHGMLTLCRIPASSSLLSKAGSSVNELLRQARQSRRRDGLLDANGVFDGLDITLSVVLIAGQTSSINFLVQADSRVITNSLHGSRGRRSDPCNL